MQFTRSYRKPVHADPSDLAKYLPILGEDGRTDGKLLKIVKILPYDDTVDQRAVDDIAFSVGLRGKSASSPAKSAKRAAAVPQPQRVVPKPEERRNVPLINWQEFNKDPILSLFKSECPSALLRLIMGYNNDLDLLAMCPNAIVGSYLFEAYRQTNLMQMLPIDPARVNPFDHLSIVVQLVSDIGRYAIVNDEIRYNEIRPRVAHLLTENRIVPFSLPLLGQVEQDHNLITFFDAVSYSKIGYMSVVCRIHNVYDSILLDQAHKAQDFYRANENLAPKDFAAAIRTFMKDNPLLWNDPDLGRQVAKLNLSSLGPSFIGLSMLPPEVGHFVNVQVLNAGYNTITHLPDVICRLNKLKELYLVNNQIRELPNNIGDLVNLENIALRNNRLRALPDSFGNLRKLTSISLEGNELSEFPESICKLTQLTHLWFGGNKVKRLPDSFGNLSSLRELNLRSNELSVLPDSFSKLVKMQSLYLSNNKLKELPEYIVQFTDLESLSFSVNELEKFPNFISRLQKLRYLSLNRENMIMRLC